MPPCVALMVKDVELEQAFAIPEHLGFKHRSLAEN